VGPGSRISRRLTILLAAVFFALLASACGPEASRPPNNQEASRPADNQEAWQRAEAYRFSAQVDHPLAPLAPVPVTNFEGTERRFLA
jgi:hypothetical protein